MPLYSRNVHLQHWGDTIRISIHCQRYNTLKSHIKRPPIRYDTILLLTVRYSTILFNIMRDRAMRCDAKEYCTMEYKVVQIVYVHSLFLQCASHFQQGQWETKLWAVVPFGSYKLLNECKSCTDWHTCCQCPRLVWNWSISPTFLQTSSKLISHVFIFFFTSSFWIGRSLMLHWSNTISDVNNV